MKSLLLCILALLAATCRQRTELIRPADQVIFLAVRGLPPLAAGNGHYEAWLGFANPSFVKNSSAQNADSTLASIGTFDVDSTGRLVDMRGKSFVPGLSERRNLQYAIDAFISIEPEGDTDRFADSLIIGGEFTGSVHVGTATLSSSYREIEGSHSAATASVTIYR